MSKKIKTRQNIEWHFMHYYLYNIHYMRILKNDKNFINLLSKLEKYVNEKIEPIYETDISDMYVIIEQII